MQKKTIVFSIVTLMVAMSLISCNALTNIVSSISPARDTDTETSSTLAATQVPISVNQDTAQVVAQPQGSQVQELPASLAAYETTLEDIYTLVNPSVVYIQVVQKQEGSSNTSMINPFSGSPFSQQQNPSEQYSQALGSGIVWDTEGHIVTNNHVVADADEITVKFSDDTIVPATIVGSDPDSDLAVIKVDTTGLNLTPIQIADSTTVKVGQVAIAIGNPFGLENTMTTGIVSAIDRSLSASTSSSLTSSGSTYTIPDIIQTDASINPGNSGGALVNSAGQLIGITSAIETLDGANAGVGFAIPTSIVVRVVPQLIETGQYDHPYLGISGTTLTADLAEAMDVDTTQRGVLVMDVVRNGPADKAGLRGSDTEVTILGQQTVVGGDIITAIDGQTLTEMDALIAYLADHTTVGQEVQLSLLRDGSQMTVNVTLEARPASQ